MQVTPIEAEAIERFALHVTVPIFLEVGDSSRLLATATHFRIDERSFLITARHIFDKGLDLEKLAYPENPLQGGLYTLGAFTVLKPSDEHIDVAALELTSEDTVKRLTENWQSLSLENVAVASANTGDGTCFVSGYPESLTKNEAGWIKGKLATAFTQRLPTVPAEAEAPVVSELDLFFDYSREAKSVSGQVIKTPELPGVSGASVWELRPSSGVWAPEKVTRVVGIQSAYLHSKYIRAKSWWAVAKVLEQADPTLAEVVRAKLLEI